MSRIELISTWTIAIACLAPATAHADSALAGPGDCAQPIRDLDVGPVLPSVSSAAVAGPPASHFAPIAIIGSQTALLPSTLTRTTQTVDAVADESVSLLGDLTNTLLPGEPSAPSDPVPILPDGPILPLPSDPISTLPGDPLSTLPGDPTSPLPIPTAPLDPVLSTVDGVLE